MSDKKIPMKQAILFAKKILMEMFSDDHPKEVALEELESTDQHWIVTLGYFRRRSVNPVKEASSFTSLFNYSQQPNIVENRVYKTIYLDAATGDFVKMEIRSVS